MWEKFFRLKDSEFSGYELASESLEYNGSFSHFPFRLLGRRLKELLQFFNTSDLLLVPSPRASEKELPNDVRDSAYLGVIHCHAVLEVAVGRLCSV